MSSNCFNAFSKRKENDKKTDSDLHSTIDWAKRTPQKTDVS